jgi:hypothetical protein
MLIPAFVRPLVGGILLAGLGGRGMPLVHAAPDACALFTLAELTAAVGQPVLGGNPSRTGDGGGQCMYGYGNMNQIGVELFQYPSAAAAQTAFAKELKDSQDGDKATQKTTVQTGIGDGAFSAAMKMGTMMAANWSAVRGTKVIHIVTMGQVALPDGRMRALMMKAISR